MMCDSIEVEFPIEQPSPNDYWPFVVSETYNHNGEALRRRSPPKFVRSPFTTAEFKVTAVIRSDDTGQVVVTGYRVGVNVPACLVGNNAILTNDVYAAVETAYRLLKHHLLNEKIDVHLLAKIAFERASILSVTLTFLFRLGSLDEAQAANEKLHRRAALLWDSPSADGGIEPVRAFSTGKSTTVYVTPPRKSYEITSYVKAGPTKKLYKAFPSPEIKNQVYQESGKLLRVEPKLNARWLKDNRLDTVDAWRGVKEFTVQAHDDPEWVNPYQRAFQLIRDALRLDVKLRLRKPRPQDLAALSETRQSIVRAHLAGQDYRNHPALMNKSRSQFSRVKIAILNTLRIDLTIPWATQRGKLSTELSDILSWNNRRKVPLPLAEWCLSRRLAAEMLAELDAILESRIRERDLTRLELIQKLAGPPGGEAPGEKPTRRSDASKRGSRASASRIKRRRGQSSSTNVPVRERQDSRSSNAR